MDNQPKERRMTVAHQIMSRQNVKGNGQNQSVNVTKMDDYTRKILSDRERPKYGQQSLTSFRKELDNDNHGSRYGTKNQFQS